MREKGALGCMLLSAVAGSFIARCFVCSGVTGDQVWGRGRQNLKQEGFAIVLQSDFLNNSGCGVLPCTLTMRLITL